MLYFLCFPFYIALYFISVRKTMKTAKTFGTAYCDAFLKYFTFSGRASRYDYWAFRLFDTFVVLAFVLLIILLPPLAALAGLYNLVTVIPSLSLLSRRLHDRGKSFWLWGAIVLLIIAGSVFLATDLYRNTTSRVGMIIFVISVLVSAGLALYIFVLTCLKGDAKANQYGPAIKEKAEYVSKGKWYMITYLLLVVLGSVVYLGLIAYVAESEFNDKIQQTNAQIDLLQKNIHTTAQGRGYDGLTSQAAIRLHLVKPAMIRQKGLVNLFDGAVLLDGNNDEFIITYHNVPARACKKLRESSRGKNFSQLLLNNGRVKTCDECPNGHCDMSWIFQ